MKKMHILVAALMALLALSVVASVASATVTFLLAEWLLEGNAITTADLVETEGELELVNLNGGGLGVVTKILCSGIFVGTVGPASADLITEALNLALEKISNVALTGLEFVCTNDQNCEGPKVWAEEMPWETELELMEEEGTTSFVDLLLNGKYYAECTILGVKINELCTTAETAIEAKNEAGGVDEFFSDAFQTLAGLKLGDCSGRTEVAEVNGLATVKPVGGGSLTVSSGP